MPIEEQKPNEVQEPALQQTDVIRRWSVALVYLKEVMQYNSMQQSIDLRLFITNAQSESEALGKAVLYFDKEVEAGYRLSNKVILPINGV